MFVSSGLNSLILIENGFWLKQIQISFWMHAPEISSLPSAIDAFELLCSNLDGSIAFYDVKRMSGEEEVLDLALVINPPPRTMSPS